MTIHPWTMYEIARSRDEERMLRAEEARRALRVKKEAAEARADSLGTTTSWLDRLQVSMSAWAQSHHLRPTHVRHV